MISRNTSKTVLGLFLALALGVIIGCFATDNYEGAALAVLTTAVPATAVVKGRREGGVAPVLDTKNMSKEDMEKMLQNLYAKVNTPSNGAFSIRFNDGSDPAPDRQVDGKTVPGSKRDSGAISVYGFGRNPVTLYAGQWIELLGTSAHSILSAIQQKADDIDAYIAKKTGNHKQDLNRAQLKAALALFSRSENSEGDEALLTGSIEGEGGEGGDTEVDPPEDADAEAATN